MAMNAVDLLNITQIMSELQKFSFFDLEVKVHVPDEPEPRFLGEIKRNPKTLDYEFSS